MTREQKRVAREIACLREKLKAVAGRKFPWCGAPPEQCRREGISLGLRIEAKYKERARLEGYSS